MCSFLPHKDQLGDSLIKNCYGHMKRSPKAESEDLGSSPDVFTS